MYHSSFDLEIHARAKREQAMRDAAAARLAAAAHHGRLMRLGGDRSHKWGLGALFRSWLADYGAVRAAPATPTPSGGILGAVSPAIDGSMQQSLRPGGAAGSLAGLVIIARGASSAGVRRERAAGER